MDVSIINKSGPKSLSLGNSIFFTLSVLNIFYDLLKIISDNFTAASIFIYQVPLVKESYLINKTNGKKDMNESFLVNTVLFSHQYSC